jgi:hypothetical protein
VTGQTFDVERCWRRSEEREWGERHTPDGEIVAPHSSFHRPLRSTRFEVIEVEPDTMGNL